MSDLIELVQQLGHPRVLVVGDVMLDRYVWGNAERISQEAPVILLRADSREERLGGASSVATMLQALGAKTSLVGIVGRDGGYTAKEATACVIVPTVNAAHVTPHSEAFQAVIWHLFVSHPDLKVNQTKWESVTAKP